MLARDRQPEAAATPTPGRIGLVEALEEVRQLVESANTPGWRRNGRSATERVCAMASVAPTQVPAEAASIRTLLGMK